MATGRLRYPLRVTDVRFAAEAFDTWQGKELRVTLTSKGKESHAYLRRIRSRKYKTYTDVPTTIIPARIARSQNETGESPLRHQSRRAARLQAIVFASAANGMSRGSDSLHSVLIKCVYHRRLQQKPDPAGYSLLPGEKTTIAQFVVLSRCTPLRQSSRILLLH